MNYKTFFEMFLREMPARLNGNNNFEMQLMAVREMLESGAISVRVSNDIFKLEKGNDGTYWVGDSTAETVAMICGLSVSDEFLKVNLTSKKSRRARWWPAICRRLVFCY